MLQDSGRGGLFPLGDDPVSNRDRRDGEYGESQLLIGAEMEQIAPHHRNVLCFMLRERRDLPTN